MYIYKWESSKGERAKGSIYNKVYKISINEWRQWIWLVVSCQFVKKRVSKVRVFLGHLGLTLLPKSLSNGFGFVSQPAESDFIKTLFEYLYPQKMELWVIALVVELILNSNKRFCGGFGEGISWPSKLYPRKVAKYCSLVPIINYIPSKKKITSHLR